MTNETILAYAFLDGVYRQYGCEFRLWHEMQESDRQQHTLTARRFIEHPDLTPKETHETWVARRLADGWVVGDHCDAKTRVHNQLVAYEELSEDDQAGEAAGVQAMRDALPHALANRLPPDLEFEVMKRITMSNANVYLKVGDDLGLDLMDQPSSMLFWGSLANARHHVELLNLKGALTEDHLDLVESGTAALRRSMGKDPTVKPAVPGGRRDHGPFDCTEDDLEHGLFTHGAVHLNSAFSEAMNEASEAGYCQRCLSTAQIGIAVSVLVSGARAEGMQDDEIMKVISNVVAHGVAQSDAGRPLPHQGMSLEVLQ
jgi:hypothetical protein